jgi:hypothetical protein
MVGRLKEAHILREKRSQMQPAAPIQEQMIKKESDEFFCEYDQHCLQDDCQKYHRSHPEGLCPITALK